MITILAVAAAAIGAVVAYNKSKTKNPAKAEAVVTKIRQASAVVAAITDAFWAVLDALMYLQRPKSGGSPQIRQSTFGRTLAADVSDG